jgi:hypothetical protein
MPQAAGCDPPRFFAGVPGFFFIGFALGDVPADFNELQDSAFGLPDREDGQFRVPGFAILVHPGKLHLAVTPFSDHLVQGTFFMAVGAFSGDTLEHFIAFFSDHFIAPVLHVL